MHSSIDCRLRRLMGAVPKRYWDERITSKPGYWGERILAQIFFAHEMSKVNGGAYDDAVRSALSIVERGLEKEGVIGRETALAAEEALKELAPEAKKYTVLCVAHAHIDMNWMWPWEETVAVTLDTFRTMLRLMEEYPAFTFSQSQASVYRIVEQYDPEMLEEIRRRVKEGRWEVTASHWVEADKNMPSGESLTRHLLYTKRYLSRLFDLDPGSLDLDFEPDTFGHSVNVPEILASGGGKYYYHCRGGEGPLLYRWEAPSGRSVIVYREPTWYIDSIQPVLGAYAPAVCRQTGLSTYLNVYGVGDHGGGPTRRDLERMLDMQGWPVYPNLRFGTYREFFALAESVADRLPTVRGELNFVFTGCYTSQTRIKTANRIGEAVLGEAEAFGAAAAAAVGARYPGVLLENAWRNVLFNQFHDILPGSGVLETREHALGLFQETFAIANTSRKLALEKIAAAIDTSALAGPDDRLSVSEGAGAGFGVREFRISQVERGRGGVRIVHVFNPLPHEREEAVEITLWDWNSPVRALSVRDGGGREVPHQVLEEGFHQYWGHEYVRLLAHVKVPALGYATLTVSEGTEELVPPMPLGPRTEQAEQFVLENEWLRAEFDPADATVRSLVWKPTGEELADPARPAGQFRLIREDPSRGMTAWQVGRYMSVESVHRGGKMRTGTRGGVRQSIHYELAFGRSSLKVTVSLDRNSPRLDFRAECDWQETGAADRDVPQLAFLWPLGYDAASYKYDVPFGVVERGPLDHDVPGNSFALGVRKDENGPSVMIVTDNKYGFRGTDRSLSVSLIRGSFDPDPYPEIGNHHRFSLGVCVCPPSGHRGLIETARRFCHPLLALSGTVHAGTRPLSGSFLELAEGSVAVSAVKMPEDAGGARWIVRVYETDGKPAAVKLRLFRPAARARLVDANERPVSDDSGVRIEGDTVSFEVAACSVAAVCIEFD